ncbi:MAG: hypothetical protein WBQ25_19770 [Nitrososphaeraceae archaeon]
MSQKKVGIILMSTMIAIGIATIANSINIALAQFNPNIPFSPSTGQSPSSLSPPSTPSTQSTPPPPPTHTNRPVKVNPPHAENITAHVVNSSTIGPPPRPIVVGPSSFTASPITGENQGNVNAPSIIPSNNGSSLGVPGR